MSGQPAVRASSWLPVSRRVAARCGILGPILLVLYFGAPAFTGWPYAGASPEQVTAYATTHAWLFYAGAWLQVTGTLLSLVFFMGLRAVPAPRAAPGAWCSSTLLPSRPACR